MINIEKTDTYGWEAAVRGMRNPKNSWEKSDSHYCWEPRYSGGGCPGCERGREADCRENKFVIGKNDLGLMKTLAAAGNDHGKFLRMITVTADLTAPLYWWKEFDTYKVEPLPTLAPPCTRSMPRNLYWMISAMNTFLRPLTVQKRMRIPSPAWKLWSQF